MFDVDPVVLVERQAKVSAIVLKLLNETTQDLELQSKLSVFLLKTMATSIVCGLSNDETLTGLAFAYEAMKATVAINEGDKAPKVM